VKLSPILEESEGELDCSQLTSEEEFEEKPPSLTEQALGLKHALRQLAEMVSGQAASVETQNTVQSLQKERWGDLDILRRVSRIFCQSSLSFSQSDRKRVL